MSEIDCGRVRELIPDHASGRLGPDEQRLVDAHVTGCGACGSELQLAALLWEGRPEAPATLRPRISRALVGGRPGANRPWWGLTAAAVAALALGIGLSSSDAGVDAGVYVPSFASEVEEGEIWLSDDGLVAGAPLFDELSDEALVELLDQLATGGPGGAA